MLNVIGLKGDTIAWASPPPMFTKMNIICFVGGFAINVKL